MQQKENKPLHSLLIFVLLSVFILTAARAQNYPVQVIPQLLPPYSLNLTDYYTGSREKLAVTLINRDLQKPVLQVRLRMSIESQDVIIRSRDNTFYPSINLEPGIPLRISLNDLAPYFNTNNLDFQGITRMQYQQGAKLPDGLYRFNFEAVEVITGKVVSQKSYAMAWLSLSDPPLINIPRKGETIAFREPQNIIFQWTPRHMSSPNSAFSTEYEFSLVEIWDNGVAPESAFLSAQPLYQTTTRATTLLYGPGEPPLLPGKRYGWRIRAKAQSGAEDYDLFRNQGYSEIYWFTQSPDCKVPLNIQVSITGSIPTISWNADVNKIDYVVEYREKDNFKAQWFSQKTTENRMSLYDVKAGKTYEYRVGASCQPGEYVYTDIQSFEIKKPTGKGTVNCGLEAKFDIANKTLIQTLNAGETILAGDFPVKLTEVRGNGSFSGKGYITIPFIGMLNIAVAFDRIKVNTDRQLIDGVIVTVNDVKESQIADVNEVAAQVKLLTDIITEKVKELAELLKKPKENQEAIVTRLEPLYKDMEDMVDDFPISDEEKEARLQEIKKITDFAKTAATGNEENSTQGSEAAKQLTAKANELAALTESYNKSSESGIKYLQKLKELIIAKKPYEYTVDGSSRPFISRNILLGDISIAQINVSYTDIPKLGVNIDLQNYKSRENIRGPGRGIKIGNHLQIMCKDEADKQKLIAYLWGKDQSQKAKEGLVIFANGFKIDKELGAELVQAMIASKDQTEFTKMLIDMAKDGDFGRNKEVAFNDDSNYWLDIDDAFKNRIGYSESIYVDGSYDMKTAKNAIGFNSRISGGKEAGEKIVAMLNTNKEIKLSSKTIPIDIVAHSMGFAYALGVIDVLQKAGYKIGMIYAIAPENPGEGYVPANIEGIWQYGTNENDGLDWRQHDQIAPQSPIRGINILDSSRGGRTYIPEYVPKGPVASHSIVNYGWIFSRTNNQDGYVKERK